MTLSAKIGGFMDFLAISGCDTFSTFLMHSIWWNGLHILQRYLWHFVRWCCHLWNRFTTPSTNWGSKADRLHWLSCYIFTRESSFCFHRVLAIAILSVRPSVCLSLRLSVRPSHGWNEIGLRLDFDATLLSLCDADREFGICILT